MIKVFFGPNQVYLSNICYTYMGLISRGQTSHNDKLLFRSLLSLFFAFTWASFV
jgi:hypothetical protein